VDEKVDATKPEEHEKNEQRTKMVESFIAGSTIETARGKR
jgi:hypothetical protein